jgi:UDP-N-acetyl-D-glucosamine dehydrogenase
VQTTTDPKTSPSSREGNLNEVQYVGYRRAVVRATAGSGGNPIGPSGYRTGPNEIVAGLRAGRSNLDDVTDNDIMKMKCGRFCTIADPNVIALARAVVSCVPTPLSEDGGPDLSGDRGRRERCGTGGAGYSGVDDVSRTIDDVVRPVLDASGSVAGVNFNLTFSPERFDPGNQEFGPRNTEGDRRPHREMRPGGGRFREIVQTVVKTKGGETEMTKPLKNTSRHINIAAVNQLARLCHDLNIDLWELIGAASTKPFRFQSFRRGPGASGHCIPIDPNYLSHNMRAKLGYPFRCVEPGEEINNSLPADLAGRVQILPNRNSEAVRGSLMPTPISCSQTTRSMTWSSPVVSELGRRRHVTDLHQRRRTSRPGDNIG